MKAFNSGELSMSKTAPADRAKAFLLDGIKHGARVTVAQEIKSDDTLDGTTIKGLTGYLLLYPLHLVIHHLHH